MMSRSDDLYERYRDIVHKRGWSQWGLRTQWALWGAIIKGHPDRWTDWTEQDFDEAYALLERIEANPLLDVLGTLR